MNHLSFNHSCTNHSPFFVLVGDGCEYISHHETLNKAYEALERIDIGNSKWSSIKILGPDETISINNFERTIYDDQPNVPDRFTLDSLFKEGENK